MVNLDAGIQALMIWVARDREALASASTIPGPCGTPTASPMDEDVQGACSQHYGSMHLEHLLTDNTVTLVVDLVHHRVARLANKEGITGWTIAFRGLDDERTKLHVGKPFIKLDHELHRIACGSNSIADALSTSFNFIILTTVSSKGSAGENNKVVVKNLSAVGENLLRLFGLQKLLIVSLEHVLKVGFNRLLRVLFGVQSRCRAAALVCCHLVLSS